MSGASSVVACGESVLLVTIVPLLSPWNVLITFYTPFSSVLSHLLASCFNPQTISFTCLHLLELCPKVFLTRSNPSIVSLTSSIVSKMYFFVYTSSSILALAGGAAAFNCELDETALHREDHVCHSLCTLGSRGLRPESWYWFLVVLTSFCSTIPRHVGSSNLDRKTTVARLRTPLLVLTDRWSKRCLVIVNFYFLWRYFFLEAQ